MKEDVNRNSNVNLKIDSNMDSQNYRTIVYTDGSCINHIGGYGCLYIEGKNVKTFNGRISGKEHAAGGPFDG